MDVNKGDKTPFFRKGKKDDWKNTFSEEEEAIFWQIHGEAMRSLGYTR